MLSFRVLALPHFRYSIVAKRKQEIGNRKTRNFIISCFHFPKIYTEKCVNGKKPKRSQLKRKKVTIIIFERLQAETHIEPPKRSVAYSDSGYKNIRMKLLVALEECLT